MIHAISQKQLIITFYVIFIRNSDKICINFYMQVKFMIKTCPIQMRVSFNSFLVCSLLFTQMSEISLFPMQLKRWERKKCKPNSLPVLHKMHVRIGDTVQVIAGREKGKVGEVTRLFKHNSTVIVKDLNLKSKHKKGTEDEPGEIVMVSIVSLETSFCAASS